MTPTRQSGAIPDESLEAEAAEGRMDALKEFFKRDQFAGLAGAELLSVAPGQARARMTIESRHLNGMGNVMGGAIFTLADFAFAAASNSHGTAAVAINASISFVKAAQSGTLWAEAREVAKNSKIGTYTVEVRDDSGDVVAVFQGLAYRKRDKLP